MSFLTWLPDVLRDAGIDVYVMPGAEERSTWRSGLTVKGIVWHHTATGPNWSDGHVAALLRDGRRDLRGPLSQVGIERDGTWVIIALGRANHNGYGLWSNDSIGLEFYNRGDGADPWPKLQIDSGILGTAAILRHLGQTPHHWVKAHRETDPSRKIDPPKSQINMDAVRSNIATRLARPRHTNTTEDDNMHVELILAAYRRVRGANYDPRISDPHGWTHWMRSLATQESNAGRNNVVHQCESLLAHEASQRG